MILTRLCARRDWRLNASQTRHLEIRNSLNTNMRTEQYENPKNIAAWLSNWFDHKRSANIRLDLLSSQTTTDGFLSINDELAEKIARRFRNDLNQFCFGNAARRGHKELIITIALQKDPHWHFHIQVEIPEHKSFESIKSFVENLSRKPNSWIKQNLYCSETKSDIGTQLYNSRSGANTVIIF